MRPLCIFLFFGAALSAPAAADDRGAAREHYFRGNKAFDLGLYDTAIAEYMAAYQAKEDPAFLYNIAQSHRLAGHTKDAVRFYKVYLARASNPPNRADVEARIAELQKTVEQDVKIATTPMPDQAAKPRSLPAEEKPSTEPAPAAENAPRSPTETAAALPTETTTAPQAAPSAAVVATSPRPGRTKRLAGIGVAVGGLALVAVGAAFGALAQADSDQLSQLRQTGGTYSASLYSQGQTYQIMEGVFLGAGAVAVLTGVVLYALGHRESKRAAARVSSSWTGVRVSF